MVANQDLFDLFGDIVKSLPYLSVVIPFRNDDYSENALEKFNFSLKWNRLHQSLSLIKTRCLRNVSLSCLTIIYIDLY